MRTKTRRNKTPQEKIWEGQFGSEYIERNSDLSLFEKRKPFFENILQKHQSIKKILEVGCNIGGNLFQLQQISNNLNLYGVELNSHALAKAQKLVPSANLHLGSIQDYDSKLTYDLVFTAGVLIHIADEDLPGVMKKIYDLSNHYILTIEYYAPNRSTLLYRGLDQALFKRPFDKEWTTLYPNLKLVDKGFLNIAQGFDDSNWWLFSKK